MWQVKYYSLIIISLLFLSCGDDENMCEEFYPNGQLMYQVPCDKWTDTFNGEMKTYDDEGNLIQRDFYQDDILVDTSFRYYAETGNLKAIIPMQHGLKEGFVKYYYPDGKTLRIDGEFYRGSRYGKYRKYRDDGTLIISLTYYYNRRNGGFGVFRPSGMPYFTGDFLGDRIDGLLRFFNDDGEVIRTLLWEEPVEQFQTEAVNEVIITVPIENEGNAFIQKDSVWLELN